MLLIAISVPKNNISLPYFISHSFLVTLLQSMINIGLTPMKKLLILSLLTIFITPFCSAQSTVDLGRKLVNSNAGDVQSILKNEVSYYQVHVSEKKKTVV